MGSVSTKGHFYGQLPPKRHTGRSKTLSNTTRTVQHPQAGTGNVAVFPQSRWPMDHETRSAYVAHRAQQTRAAALSAFQTLPYMPSWRELAAARRQHGFIGLYEPI